MRAASLRALTAPNDFEFTPALAAQRLGGIRAFNLQALEIFGRHIARHILTREAGRIELSHARIIVLTGGHEILEILIDQPVRANEMGDLIDAAMGSDELARRGHIDAVNIGKPDRRSGRREVNFLGAGLPCKVDDLRRSRAAHNGIVDEEYVLAAELQVDGIQLAAD